MHAAVVVFGEEIHLGKPSCADAPLALDGHFISESSSGPAKSSHFVFGDILPGESADTCFLCAAIRQDMVAVAEMLLKAANYQKGQAVL